MTSGPLAPSPTSQVTEVAFADILVSGAAQHRHRQKRVLRAVIRSDEAEAFAGVEPLDLGFDDAAGRGIFARKSRGGDRTWGIALNLLRGHVWVHTIA